MKPEKTTQAANPIAVEVVRGSHVESRHRVAAAVVDTAGTVLLAVGDIERPVYARSAIKPLQALPLIETGAADRFEIGDAEIALACASHSGEAEHVAAALAWLARIGCSADDLECGPHLPLDDDAANAVLAAGGEAERIHNNCSGKHAGFLTVARHLGVAAAGYIRYDHAVQQRVLGVLEQMAGLDLGNAPRGIDGCGIPVVAMPLGNVALAMARLADPADQPEPRQDAARRVRRAMAAHPFLVAGSGRFDTDIMAVTGEKAVVKVGAEGVYCAALPGPGIGIALKIDDGARRAAEAAMGRLLRRFDALTDTEAAALADTLEPPVLNHAGDEVGRVRPAADCPF